MKGCQRSNQKKGFCVVVPDTHGLWCALCRLVWVVIFGGKKLYRLEFTHEKGEPLDGVGLDLGP